MKISIITITGEASRVPTWAFCSTKDIKGNTSKWILSTAVRHRIKLVGLDLYNLDEIISVGDVEEVYKGLFVQEIDLPPNIVLGLNKYNSNAELFVDCEHHDENHRMVILMLDRNETHLLRHRVEPAIATDDIGRNRRTSSIVNTFHTAEWNGCVVYVPTRTECLENTVFNPIEVDYYKAGQYYHLKIVPVDCDDSIHISHDIWKNSTIRAILIDKHAQDRIRFFRVSNNCIVSTLFIAPTGTLFADIKENIYRSNINVLPRGGVYEIYVLATDVNTSGGILNANDVSEQIDDRYRSLLFYNCKKCEIKLKSRLWYISQAVMHDDGRMTCECIKCP